MVSRGTVSTSVFLSGCLILATKPGHPQANEGTGTILASHSSLPSLHPPTQAKEEATMVILYLLSHRSDPKISQELYFKRSLFSLELNLNIST